MDEVVVFAHNLIEEFYISACLNLYIICVYIILYIYYNIYGEERICKCGKYLRTAH